MIHQAFTRAAEPVLPVLQREFGRLAGEGTCIDQYVLRLQDKVREARLRGQQSEYLDLLSSLLAAVSMERHTAGAREPMPAMVEEWISRWWPKVCQRGFPEEGDAAGPVSPIVLSTQASEEEHRDHEEEKGLESTCERKQDEEEEADGLREPRGSHGSEENSSSESWESEAERVREMFPRADARKRAPPCEVHSVPSPSSRKRRYLEVVGQSSSSSSRLAPLRLLLPAWLPDDFEVEHVRLIQRYAGDASSASAVLVAHALGERERDPAAGTQE